MEAERKRRVLVVEDDPRLRSALARLLAGWGYEAEVASDGIEALEKIASFHPTIVISDLRMPRMDGLQLLTVLRRTSPSLSFILLSGYERLSKAQVAIASSGCTFLEKPLNPGELKAKLQNCSPH